MAGISQGFLCAFYSSASLALRCLDDDYEIIFYFAAWVSPVLGMRDMCVFV
jgi:hypothetical protein